MIPVFVTMAIYYGQSIERGAPLEWIRFTAIAIFLVAAVSDGLDGYVARRYNQRSSLGVILVGAGVLHLLVGKVHVRPRWTGKVATVSQMIAIGWVMLQFHFIPLFYIVIGAGFFTLVSGVVYVTDGVRQLQAEGHANAKRD